MSGRTNSTLPNCKTEANAQFHPPATALCRPRLFCPHSCPLRDFFISACKKPEISDTPEEAAAQTPVRENSPALSSRTCRECHSDIFAAWSDSHHGNANRKLKPDFDDGAFQPPKEVRDSSGATIIRKHGEEFQFLMSGDQDDERLYHPQMVIGHSPIRQYVVPFPGGRQQVFPLAWDPEKEDWFNVFGDEKRDPGEWGHWSQRGMNWNSQCASCHMTFFDKGYDSKSDSYTSTWAEQGITCLQCHGPMVNHVTAVTNPNYKRVSVTSTQTMDSCASCHSRREELTGNFKSGDSFHDHFRLTLPTHPDLYYPDGQIREEVYVYGSLKMSRMGQAGVTCLDCHDPHSGNLKLPVGNNALCLSCHDSSRRLGAPHIDPVVHSRHPSGSTGNRCVECHMSATTYMQRDPRRDHGFIIPDPVLTKELGIPNACNRCHGDQTVDWSIEWWRRWFDDRNIRTARDRARFISSAYKGDPAIEKPLSTLIEKEENPIWKAGLITLAGRWSHEPGIRSTIRGALKDTHPLVRSASVLSLAPYPEEGRRIGELAKDPVRLVRIDAASALHQQSSPSSPVQPELTKYVEFNSDQPAGADRKAQLAFRSGNLDEAEKWFRKAVEWDKLSPGLLQNLALFLNAQGRYKGAIEALQKARQLDSSNPDFPFMLALIYAETNDTKEAERYLRLALKADPVFARAWYNLSLLLARKDRLEEAIEAIEKPKQSSPMFPTILTSKRPSTCVRERRQRLERPPSKH